jgi:phosphoglycolate phosphatase
MKNFWIFDFDGTLVDSESSIKNCYLKVTMNSCPERIEKAKKITIGPTLLEISNQILGQKLIHLQEKFIEKFKDEYDRREIFKSNFYPNTDNVLKKLHSRGDKIAIATNKRQSPTMSLIKHYGWTEYFEWIACIDKHQNVASKSEMLKIYLEKYKHFKSATFIGDTVDDGLSAYENNLSFIWAKYGYGCNQNWSNIPIKKSILSLVDLL